MSRYLVAFAAAVPLLGLTPAVASAAPSSAPGPADPVDTSVRTAAVTPSAGTTLGPWHLAGHYSALSLTADEGSRPRGRPRGTAASAPSRSTFE